jgi:hypothetical protein
VRQDVKLIDFGNLRPNLVFGEMVDEQALDECLEESIHIEQEASRP